MGAFYLISGSDDYAVKDRSGEFIRELCGEIPEDNSNLEIIRGDNDNEKAGEVLEKLLDSLNTPSFFAPKKTVWLKHFNKFEDAFDEPSTKKKPSRIERLSEFLKEGVPPDITLIIDGSGLDRRKAFFKLCEKLASSSGGSIQWFEKTDTKVKGYETVVVRKIKEIAMSAGKRMDDAAATYVMETIGTDTAALKSEVEKLIAFVGNEPEIRKDDCYEICSRNSDALAWQFAGALAERNPEKALSLIPGIIESMEQEKGSSSRPEMAIAAAANNEFKRLVAIRCEGKKYRIPQRAAADFFYRLFEDQKANHPGDAFFAMHPYRAFKTWENAMRFTDRELAEIFNAIFEASKGMVTGTDPRIALEMLVAKTASMKNT